MKRPDDISGIRRFLGMVNQLNKFSPKITELTKPLRELLKVFHMPTLWQVLPFQFARIASLCPTLIWTRTPQALDFRLVSA
jgi:hypothetical protein